jgi:hypothetical protein
MLFKLNNWFLTNNIFIAICSVATLKYFSIVTKVGVAPNYFYISFFSTLCAYNFLRNNHFKLKSIKSLVIVLSALISVAEILLFFAPNNFLYIIPLAIVVTYRYPIILGTTLRSKPMLKLSAISLTWILMSTIPLLNQHLEEAALHKLIFASLAEIMLIGALSISFDVFDLKSDKTKTIATVLGAARSMILAELMVVVYLMINVLFTTSFREKLAHTLVSVLATCVFFGYKKLSTKSLQYYFADGLLLLQVAVLFVLD